MSLFDMLQSEDPAIQNGLLNFGLSLLQSKGNFGNAVGRAGQAAQLGARDFRQQEALLKRAGMNDKLIQMQLDEQQRQAAQRQHMEELAKQYSRSPQQQAMAQNGGPTMEAASAAPNTAPGFDYQGYAGALAGINPIAALDLQGKLRKENPKLSRLEVMRGQDGQPINVAVFEDGTSKILPYGVKPEIALQNMGNRVVSIDKNAAQNGQSWALGVSPDSQLSANTTMRGQNMTDSRAREGLGLQRERLAFDQGASVADTGGPSQAPLVKAYGKPSAGYRWKQDGSQEAIPGGPADEKTKLKSVGEGTVDGVVAQLRDKYAKLQEGGGITDPAAGPMANLAAGAGSSGVGQAFGRAFGTQNQSTRNEIAMARPLLLQSIMKATGMSAKQMDSNAELKLWLATATDPTLDVKSNLDALDRIEKLYGSGGVSSPSAPKAPKATVSNW